MLGHPETCKVSGTREGGLMLIAGYGPYEIHRWRMILRDALVKVKAVSSPAGNNQVAVLNEDTSRVEHAQKSSH